jgi:hypothetical protein
MTLLEYIVSEYLGPPYKVDSYGQAWWVCPMCTKVNKFHTRPHKPQQYPDRVSCYRCNWFGKEDHFLQLMHPDEKYPAILNRLDDLREEYEEQGKANMALVADGKEPTPAGATPTAPSEPRVLEISMPGLGGIAREDEALVRKVFNAMSDEELNACFTIAEAAKRHSDHGRVVDITVLVWWVYHTINERLRLQAAEEQRHTTHCEDPDHCNTCRKARGLEPLTIEQIRFGFPATLKEIRERAANNGHH